MQDELEKIASTFAADTATIHLLEGDVLALKAHVGLPPHVASIVSSVPVGKGMAGLCVERNAPVSSCNIQTDTTGDVRPGAKATGVNGAIVVPIRDRSGSVRGALGVGVNREHTYGADEIAALSRAAATLVP